MKPISYSIAAGASLLLVTSLCSAQMQIPNPLIQPPSVQKQASPKEEASLPTPPPGQYNGPVGMPGSPYPQAGGAGQLQTKSSFTEVREKLAPFYVSAIVGNSAILRRSNAPSSVFGSAPSPQQGGPMGMSQAMNMNSGPVKPVIQGQTETMMITDGEPIDFLGDAITLTPKITASAVYIYYTEDGAPLKKGAVRRQVAFLGQVESTVATAPSAIVLQKMDSSYKQQVSVETKARGNGSTGGNASGNGGGQLPSPPPANAQ